MSYPSCRVLFKSARSFSLAPPPPPPPPPPLSTSPLTPPPRLTRSAGGSVRVLSHKFFTFISVSFSVPACWCARCLSFTLSAGWSRRISTSRPRGLRNCGSLLSIPTCHTYVHTNMICQYMYVYAYVYTSESRCLWADRGISIAVLRCSVF